jgi:hypothetical protein
MAVEGDREEMARKQLGGEKKTSCVILSGNETVIILCQGTTSETENPSACVTVICKVCRSAIAL